MSFSEMRFKCIVSHPGVSFDNHIAFCIFFTHELSFSTQLPHIHSYDNWQISISCCLCSYFRLGSRSHGQITGDMGLPLALPPPPSKDDLGLILFQTFFHFFQFTTGVMGCGLQKRLGWLCLFCCYHSSCVLSQQSWFLASFFFCFLNSPIPPPPQSSTSRSLHFKTSHSGTLSYAKTGSGSMTGIGVSCPECFKGKGEGGGCQCKTTK